MCASDASQLLSLNRSFFTLSVLLLVCFFFFFSSRRRHTRSLCDWSSDVCSSDLPGRARAAHWSRSHRRAAKRGLLRDVRAGRLRLDLGRAWSRAERPALRPASAGGTRRRSGGLLLRPRVHHARGLGELVGRAPYRL